MIAYLLELISENWRSVIEIGILWLVIYHGYLYFRGTRGAKVLTGLALILLTLIFVSQLLRLEVILWLIREPHRLPGRRAGRHLPAGAPARPGGAGQPSYF